MERLTIRSDICCEPENNIVYSNPNDPEGMYNILDLAECLYNGGEAEAGILLDISNRLAAYEDTGLTPEEVHQLKAKYEALESDKNVIESSHINAEMNLEAQQQEIDRLADETIKLMKENAKNSNKKDELVKVLKQAREAIKAAWSDGSANAAMDKASEALAAIDKAIGGKEDV